MYNTQLFWQWYYDANKQKKTFHFFKQKISIKIEFETFFLKNLFFHWIYFIFWITKSRNRCGSEFSMDIEKYPNQTNKKLDHTLLVSFWIYQHWTNIFKIYQDFQDFGLPDDLHIETALNWTHVPRCYSQNAEIRKAGVLAGYDWELYWSHLWSSPSGPSVVH